MERKTGFRQTQTGSATFMAIIMGTVFFMVVSSLLHYLSGEKRQLTHVIGKKQAEVLALSGIDWADHELRQGRWYQTAFGSTVTGGGRPSFGLKELTPFGAGNGKVTVVCEDIPAKKPATGIRNMQQLWLLHHINVFALGEFGEYRCLVYGKFIMTPEPALNDNSTDAVLFADDAGGDSGETLIRIPSVEGAPQLRVKEIRCGTGEKVDINRLLAIMEIVGDAGGRTAELRPPSHGVLREIRLSVGQTCQAGNVFGVLGAEGAAQQRTLKKMVRVTRIDEEPWSRFDIRQFQDRYALSAWLSGLSPLYLMNFTSHEALAKAIENQAGGNLPETMEADEFLRRFPASVRNPTEDRAENEFLAHLVRTFTTTPVKDWPEALAKTKLVLDHPRMDVPQDLRDKLQQLGLLNLRDTKPRKDPRLFDPSISLDKFLELLKPDFNQDPEEFIRILSELPDASRWIEVEKDPSLQNRPPTQRETGTGIEVVRPDAQTRVTVKKVTKPYNFSDPKGDFSTRMQYILDFARKYYNDDGATLPKEPKRNLEFLDWPLPAPAPAPPPTQGTGEWVWIPGQPGVPPGLPSWTHQGGKEVKVPFPSGGRRDFEPAGGPPTGGGRSYPVQGIAPESLGGGKNSSGNAPGGSGGEVMNPGAPPGGDGGESGNNGAPPFSDGKEGGQPAGSPNEISSIFTKNHPPLKIPVGGTFTGTAGPAGIPPSQGEWAWTEPCPPGGSPAGGGGDGSYATGGKAPGDGSSQQDGTGGQPPGGSGEADEGRGQNDGRPGQATGQGVGNDGQPGGADGHGVGQTGQPGGADGYGTGNTGRPGSADEGGAAHPGQPGEAVADGTATPGGAGGRPGSGNTGQGVGGSPGKPGQGASPVFVCPKCGKLHKNPGFHDGGGDSGGGGGSSGTRGGC